MCVSFQNVQFILAFKVIKIIYSTRLWFLQLKKQNKTLLGFYVWFFLCFIHVSNHLAFAKNLTWKSNFTFQNNNPSTVWNVQVIGHIKGGKNLWNIYWLIFFPHNSNLHFNKNMLKFLLKNLTHTNAHTELGLLCTSPIGRLCSLKSHKLKIRKLQTRTWNTIRFFI